MATKMAKRRDEMKANAWLKCISAVGIGRTGNEGKEKAAKKCVEKPV